MHQDELIAKIKALELENASLKNDLEALHVENEQQRCLLFKQQVQLNKLLSDQASVREKLIIEQVRPFVRKTEQINHIVINEAEAVLKTSHPRGRKKNGFNFRKIDFENSFTETRYEDPVSLFCDTCGSALVMASQKERFVVEVIPSSIKVIKIIKRAYKCPFDGRFDYPVSHSPFPGSILTPSFAAYLAYHKYELGIPFHHLEKHLSSVLNIPISKQLLATWMASLATKLTPLFSQMKSDLLHTPIRVIHADETTLIISKQPAYNANRKKSYVYVYASSYYDRQIHIYDFHESRAIDRTALWLSHYQGYIVCDDFPGYTKLAKDNPHIHLQRCFAHARRRFTDILKSLPVDQIKSSLSFQIVDLINQLFHFEDTYKQQTLPPSAILIRRQLDHPPIIERLKTLIFDAPIKPQSALESAVKYVRNIWGDLFTYLKDGYLEISNNLAERAVKPFVINRKVFMTSGSYAGARYTTILFSIIRTAVINHLDVQKYLCYIIENIDKLDTSAITPYYEKLPDYLKISWKFATASTSTRLSKKH